MYIVRFDPDRTSSSPRGAEFDENVYDLCGAAEIVFERGYGIVQCREHEPPVACNAGHWGEAVLPGIETRAVAIGSGYADQFARVRVGPAVIPAAKITVAPLVDFADDRAAMTTPVQEYPNFAILATNEDDRLPAHLAASELSGFRDLAFVTDVHPALMENTFQLELEYAGIGIDSRMHPAGRNERAQPRGIVSTARHVEAVRHTMRPWRRGALHRCHISGGRPDRRDLVLSWHFILRIASRNGCPFGLKGYSRDHVVGNRPPRLPEYVGGDRGQEARADESEAQARSLVLACLPGDGVARCSDEQRAKADADQVED